MNFVTDSGLATPQDLAELLHLSSLQEKWKAESDRLEKEGKPRITERETPLLEPGPYIASWYDPTSGQGGSAGVDEKIPLADGMIFTVTKLLQHGK